MAPAASITMAGRAVALLAMAAVRTSAFVQGPAGLEGAPVVSPAKAVSQAAGVNRVEFAFGANESSEAASENSWVAQLLSLGALFGLALGMAAPRAAQAITAEQFSQLTYNQVKGSGLANRCPTVESKGKSIPVKNGQRLINVCLEPKSFAVEADTVKGRQFVNTKLLTRQTYSIEAIAGSLTTNPLTWVEDDGMDFASTTVKLPDGQYVPFLFTIKDLVAKGDGSEFKPGFTWGGEFNVPSYRTGGFLDPKFRGMYLGYDQAVALPALQADGKSGQDALFKETNKVFETGKGAIEMEVNKVNADLNEIGGVFVSKQPSDTDMGAKEPKTILIKGIFYGKVV